MTMTEAEMLKMIRRAAGIRPPAGKQEATHPDSVIAENYASVVAEVMRRDGEWQPVTHSDKKDGI